MLYETGTLREVLSLKSSTREKLGSGSRIIVKSTTLTPVNGSFLQEDENKTELYNYLSDYISIRHTPRNMLYCAKGIDVVATSDSEIVGTDIVPCHHEEADTHLNLDALYCVKHGHRRTLIRSVDTDVVVLSIATFHALSIDELLIAFGVKKHY